MNQILMENLATQRVSSARVPYFLTNAQMNDCVTACQENLGLMEDAPNFLNHVITYNESWVH